MMWMKDSKWNLYHRVSYHENFQDLDDIPNFLLQHETLSFILAGSSDLYSNLDILTYLMCRISKDNTKLLHFATNDNITKKGTSMMFVMKSN